MVILDPNFKIKYYASYNDYYNQGIVNIIGDTFCGEGTFMVFSQD